MRIIDLSVALDEKTITIRQRKPAPVYLGLDCIGYDFTIYSHIGSYFETSAHIFPNGKNTEDVPVEKLIGPAVIVHLSPEPPRPEITGEELAQAKAPVRKGDALLVHTGGRVKRYFTRDAVGWMIEKGVTLLGADQLHYDRGLDNPTGMFIDLFRAEIPIINGLENLDRIRKSRFQLIVLPLKINGVGTVPCRILAMEK